MPGSGGSLTALPVGEELEGEQAGRFEVADGGTLFLDEIGDMDFAMQAKILRALEERAIRRVGGNSSISVDVRLITATNRDLEQAVAAGEFREDLYYRLNVVPIHLPPLRERLDDIEGLAKHYIKRFNKELGRQVTELTPEVLETFKSYPWRGNVRELRNMIERSMLLECKGETLELKHLRFHQQRHSIAARDIATEKDGPSIMPQGMSQIGQNLPMETIEKEHIESVLKNNKGNKNQTAQILGIDRTTLYNKLKKYEIK